MAGQNGHRQREVLTIPDQHYDGLVTYDARGPGTTFPCSTPLRPPADGPSVLAVLSDAARRPGLVAGAGEVAQP